MKNQELATHRFCRMFCGGLIQHSRTSLMAGQNTKSYVSSITYPQAIQKWIYKNSITLPKIGKIRMVKHRVR
ncbi:MAG: hypothetical protein ACP5NC_02635 [Nitrososphaeria archaeon]